MIGADNHLENLSKAIIADAEKTAEQMISEAKAKAEAILSEAVTQYEAEDSFLVENKERLAREKFSKEISHEDFSLKRSVLAYRNELVEGIYSAVSEKLNAYVTGDEYKQYLKNSLVKADKELKISNDCIVYCNKRDTDILTDLVKPYNCAVSQDRAIIYGGISVYYPEKKLYNDLTLDTAFEEQKKEFVNKNELAL